MNQEQEKALASLSARLRRLPPAALNEITSSEAENSQFSLCQVFQKRGLLEKDECALLDARINEIVQTCDNNRGAAVEAIMNLGSASSSDGNDLSGGPCDTLDIASTPSAPDTMEIPDAVEEAPDRYKHIANYARGGMGHILLVQDRYLGRSVALKELLPETGAIGPGGRARNAAARFLHEAKVAGQLEHPSIVPVHELGRRQDGTLFYTMKLVKGKTLSVALGERASLGERLALLPNFVDLCQAIAYAHSRGVIHRDIKPANVMVGDFGETVLLDWGLAKLQGTRDFYREELEAQGYLPRPGSERGPQTVYGRALGTPSYMSPEQAQGWIDQIDERSDVYCLGAVLYELLTGKPPFTGTDTAETLEKVVRSEPVSIIEVVPNAPPELAVICHKALLKNPDERYQTAIELAEEIRRFIAGSLVHTYSYSPKDLLLRYYRKHKAAINTIFTCVILLSAAGIYSYYSVLHARNREYEQRVAAQEAARNEKAARTKAERSEYVTQLALTQEHIERQDLAMANETAWSVLPAQRHWEWGFLLNRANPELKTVPTPPMTVCAASISPDSTLAAVQSTEGDVHLWDLDSGTLKLACDPAKSPLSCPCQFSPDGTKLVSAGIDGAVRLWEVASGKVHLLSGHSQAVLSAQFSADSTQIISASQDGSARLWDAATGGSLGVIKAGIGPLAKAVFSPDASRVALVSQDGKVRIVQIEGRAEQLQCAGTDVAFAPDASLLAVAQKGAILLWDNAQKKPLDSLKVEGSIAHFRFSERSDKLLVASRDGTGRLYDVTTGKLLCVYRHEKPLMDAFFLPGDALVVTCSLWNDFYVWEALTGRVVNHLLGRGQRLSSVDVSRDGGFMVSTVNEDLFQIWNPLYQTGRRLLSYGNTSFPCLAVCEQAHLAATLDFEAGLRLFSLPQGDQQPTFYVGNYKFLQGNSSCDLSRDGKRLCAALDCFSPLIWDLSNQHFRPLVGHQAQVYSVVFDLMGTRIVTASEDGTARIWDAESGTMLATLEDDGGPLNGAAFSPDGHSAVTASWDGTASIWNLATSKKTLTLRGHEGRVLNAAFSPDGRQIITCSEDRTARVWNVSEGLLTSILPGGDRVSDVFFAKDGRFILTSSFDGTTRLWDGIGLEPLAAFRAYCARFISGIPALITVSQQGQVEYWEAAPSDVRNPNEKLSETDNTFDRYRSSDYAKAKSQHIPSAKPARVVVAISIPTLRAGLEALRELIPNRNEGASETSAAFQLKFDEPGTAGKLRSIGLRQGDGLVKIGSLDAARTEEIVALLDQEIQQLDNQLPEKDLELSIVRDGSQIPVLIMAKQVLKQSRTVSLHRDEAKECLQIIIDGLSADEPGSAPSDAARGDEGCQLVASYRGTNVLKQLLKMGVVSNDILVALNSRKFHDAEGLLAALRELTGAIATGAVHGFQLDVQHGEFAYLEVKYEIVD